MYGNLPVSKPLMIAVGIFCVLVLLAPFVLYAPKCAKAQAIPAEGVPRVEKRIIAELIVAQPIAVVNPTSQIGSRVWWKLGFQKVSQQYETKMKNCVLVYKGGSNHFELYATYAVSWLTDGTIKITKCAVQGE